MDAHCQPVYLPLLTICAVVGSHAQNATRIRIDASQPFSEPAPALFNGGSAKSPSGGILGVNSRFLTLDGKPWLPVMGEFHFSRYPRAQWEEEILKMKAAGVNIVATYVIWIHHEEIEGQFDWTGQRDLRAFTAALRKARHVCAGAHRAMGSRRGAQRGLSGLGDEAEPDPRQRSGLSRVECGPGTGRLREQLRGLLWKDGGPVIGIQLENEYSQRGPGAGEEHILELKKIAIESGLDVPLYIVTGWDDAVVPLRRGDSALRRAIRTRRGPARSTRLPPEEVYAFRFQSRVAANLCRRDG